MGLRKKLAIRIIKQAEQREGVALYILTRNSERGKDREEHEKITNQYRGDHVQGVAQRQQERDVSIDVPKKS